MVQGCPKVPGNLLHRFNGRSEMQNDLLGGQRLTALGPPKKLLCVLTIVLNPVAQQKQKITAGWLKANRRAPKTPSSKPLFMDGS